MKKNPTQKKFEDKKFFGCPKLPGRPKKMSFWGITV
jgi:hypothetical protein